MYLYITARIFANMFSLNLNVLRKVVLSLYLVGLLNAAALFVASCHIDKPSPICYYR